MFVLADRSHRAGQARFESTEQLQWYVRFDGVSPSRQYRSLLQAALAQSAHPLSRKVAASLAQTDTPSTPRRVESYREEEGLGLYCRVEGRDIGGGYVDSFAFGSAEPLAVAEDDPVEGGSLHVPAAQQYQVTVTSPPPALPGCIANELIAPYTPLVGKTDPIETVTS